MLQPWLRGWILAIALAGDVSHVWAQTAACPGAGKGLEPVAFETITVSNTAIGLTAATITSVTAGAAFMTVEAQPLRYTLVGVPTATVGHLVESPPTGNADQLKGAWICGRTALLGLRMIRTGGSDSTVRVTFYKVR